MFIEFGLTRRGIKPESTVSVADALSTRPLIGKKPGFQKPQNTFMSHLKRPNLHHGNTNQTPHFGKYAVN